MCRFSLASVVVEMRWLILPLIVSTIAHAGSMSASADSRDVGFSRQQRVTVTPPAPPPGAPVVWIDGASLDGLNNSTLVNGQEFSATTIVNRGSLGGTFNGSVGLAPTYKANCVGGFGCLSFDGVNDVAASSVAAASYQFLHVGPSTCYAIGQPVRNVATGTTGNFAMWATSRANVGEVGEVSWLNDSQYNSSASNADLYDGAAPKAGGVTSANGAYLQQSWTRHLAWYNPADVGNDFIIYTNGVNVAETEPTAASATAPTRTFQIGAALNALYFGGNIYQVVCYSSALSGAEITALDAWGQTKITASPYPAGSCATGAAKLCGGQSPCRVGVMGDSISFASGGVTEWPDVLRTNIGGANMVIIDEAVSGARLSTAKTTQWTNRLKNMGLTALVLFIGRNDIDDNVAATTVLSDLAFVAGEATAAGIKVLTVSALPSGNEAGWTGAKTTQMLALNAGLASAAGGCRSFLDLYAAFEQSPGSNTLATIYDSGDGLHPNQPGQDALEAAIRPLVGP